MQRLVRSIPLLIFFIEASIEKKFHFRKQKIAINNMLFFFFVVKLDQQEFKNGLIFSSYLE